MSVPGVVTPGIEVQSLLFDMDGVLVSSIGSAVRCWRQWAARHGVPDAERFMLPHGVRAIDIVRMLRPEMDAEAGLREIEDLEIADAGDIVVLPGVRQLLAALPSDRWAIVTSATRRLLVARLKAAQLPLPQRIISADMVERGKPDPEPYRRGAELVGVPASACLVVEDASSGAQAGVAAGCAVLGVEGTESAAELRTAGARHVVRSLEDVAVMLQGDRIRLTFTEA